MTDPASMLDHYLNLWHLTDPHPLAETVTSQLYTVTHDGATAVLKILTPYGFEERQGAVALRHFDGHGAVRLFQSDDDAQLLEYASGEDLTGLVVSGQDEAATQIIGELINALHSQNHTPPQGMVTLRRWFKALFDQAENDRQAGLDTIFMRAAPLAEETLAHPRDPRVLHGDIHHENIRQSPRGWLAFDPKGVYGERAYDLANTLCNPRPDFGVRADDEDRILRNSAILARTCGIDQPRVLLFLYLYACLSTAWIIQSGDPESGIAGIMDIAKIAERLMRRL